MSTIYKYSLSSGFSTFQPSVKDFDGKQIESGMYVKLSKRGLANINIKETKIKSELQGYCNFLPNVVYKVTLVSANSNSISVIHPATGLVSGWDSDRFVIVEKNNKLIGWL